MFPLPPISRLLLLAALLGWVFPSAARPIPPPPAGRLPTTSQVATPGKYGKPPKLEQTGKKRKAPAPTPVTCDCPARRICLDFDTDGKLLSAPPTTLTAGVDTVVFRVRKPGTAKAERRRLFRQLAKVYPLLVSGRDDDLLQQVGFRMSSLANAQKLYKTSYLLTVYANTMKELAGDSVTLNNWIGSAWEANRVRQYAARGGEVLFDPKVLVDPVYEVIISPTPGCASLPYGLKSCNDCWAISGDVVVPAGRTFEFSLRRKLLGGNALGQQLQKPLEELNGVYLVAAAATLSDNQKLAGRVKKLLAFIDNAVGSQRADSLARLTLLRTAITLGSAELKTQNRAVGDLQTPALAAHLIRTFWVTGGKRLLVNPGPLLKADTFYYKGALHLSPVPGRYHEANLIKMRHHDAANFFGLLNDAQSSSINEQQRMVLLLHNLAATNKPFLGEVKFVVVNPPDLFTEEVLTAAKALSNDSPDGKTNKSGKVKTKPSLPKKTKTPPPNLVDTARLYVQQYGQLKARLSIFEGWTGGALAMAGEDDSPNYHSRELPHQTPLEAPVKVTYALKDSSFVSATIPGTVGYEYQFNKLHVVRFKAGLVYSNLKRNSYIINAASNTATRETKTTGLNAAFGLQVFPFKIDIRQRNLWKPFWRSSPQNLFLYGGFLVTAKPLENPLLGLGAEVYSGIAVMAGAHFGQTPVLDTANGPLTTKDRWRTGWFVQVAVGLEAFGKIFTTPITNPFK